MFYNVMGCHGDDGEIHNHMVAYFGLPVPRERSHPELFGWYHVDQMTRYWIHNPADGSFSVITGPMKFKEKEMAIDASTQDITQLSELMDSLSLLPRPPLPDDPATPQQKEPFAFEGWLFAWFFVPQLSRWELGVIERRWHVESESTSSPMDDTMSEQVLSIATKSVEAGRLLFERYCQSMLLIGRWNAPDPDEGFQLIMGAAASAAERMEKQTDIIRAVANATGCAEDTVQHVLDCLHASGVFEGPWFRGVDCKILLPGMDPH